jgi:Fur family ferric uptake transcriptional regulator
MVTVADDSELHQVADSRLGRHGHRYTPSRRRLVEVLQATEHPLTIAEVTEAGGLPQSSAYRNLAILEGSGVVRRVQTTDEFARFELAEDLTGHHHHLMCEICGTVRDVVVPDALERRLDAELERLAGCHGFVLDHHRLDLIGRCADCARSAS